MGSVGLNSTNYKFMWKEFQTPVQSTVDENTEAKTTWYVLMDNNTLKPKIEKKTKKFENL